MQVRHSLIIMNCHFNDNPLGVAEVFIPLRYLDGAVSTHPLTAILFMRLSGWLCHMRYWLSNTPCLLQELASLIFTNTSICLLQGKYMDQTCLIKARSGYGKPFRLSRNWLKNELKKNYEQSEKLRNCNHHLHLSVNKVSTENQLVIFRLCCARCGRFFCAIKKQYALNVFKLEQIPEQNMEKYFKMQTDASNYRLKLNEETYKIYNASWDFNKNQNYNEYLTTEEWHDKRRLVLNRCNYICEACGINRAVQAHHLTYENIYNENLFELVGVCIPCHKKIHNLYSDKESFDFDGSNSQ